MAAGDVHANGHGLALSQVGGIFVLSEGVPTDLATYRVSGTQSYRMQNTQALTASGLRHLGIEEPTLNSFSFEFLEGMAPARAPGTPIPRRTRRSRCQANSSGTAQAEPSRATPPAAPPRPAICGALTARPMLKIRKRAASVS